MDPDSAERQIDGFLAKYRPEVAAAARACRMVMRKRIPRGHEFVYDNYNALVFGFGPSEKPSRAVLSIAVFRRWITLCFLYGAALPDPGDLLQGSGARVRSIRLTSPRDLDRPAIKALITAALAAAAEEFDAAGRLTTVMKSVSARQRPRR